MSFTDSVRKFFSPVDERAQPMVLPPPLPNVDNLWPYMSMGGHVYPLRQTLVQESREAPADFFGYVQAMYKTNPVVFACEMARIDLFSQARFMWRRLNSGRPGDLFGSPELRGLERPWPKATTSDLLGRMLLYADLGGNAFVVRRPDGYRVLRPDWVSVIFGSEQDPEVAYYDVDADLIGIVYFPGGAAAGRAPQVFLTQSFAHFVSTPDPLAPAGLGMPWVQTVVREVMADDAATEHKLLFFQHGATPNMIVYVDRNYSDDQLTKLSERVRKEHEGRNAYRTMILRAAVERAEVVGKDFQQLDFKAVQGASETRIAAAAGVPPVVAGLSEGLQGSSLNAGNFQASMRRFADLTIDPLWRNVAGSLEPLLARPRTENGGGSPCQLWYDPADIPALKDDIKSAADVLAENATAINTLVTAGFAPDDVVNAVKQGDLALLKGTHSGLFSVQLQKPGGKEVPPSPTPTSPTPPPPPAAGGE